jgi:hypothetical protein
VTERGTGSAVRAFRGNAGDGILRVHIVSRKVPRVLCFLSLAGIPAKTVPQRAKKGPPGEAGRPFGRPQLVRNLVRPLPRSSGSRHFRLGFAAIELAHDVGVNLLFLAPFSWGTQKRGFCLQSERLLYGREPNGVRAEPGKQKTRSCRTQELARSSGPRKGAAEKGWLTGLDKQSAREG